MVGEGFEVDFHIEERGMRIFGRGAAMAVLAIGAGAMAAMASDKKMDGKGTLKVYFADVEGGQATLFVTPLGESLLVDTGWAGFDGRDADRIVALCRQAAVSRIDDVLVTHYHNDHVGGVAQLAAKIPIGRFIDHGVNREMDDEKTRLSWEAYQKVLANGKYAHMVVKPGDVLPVKGMRVEVVSADGEVIGKPVAGGGAGKANPDCARSAMKDPENDENDRSVGVLVTFGRLRILDLGDLTWARERTLMCPVNKLGQVDVYVASHHGFARSGSEALVDGIAPRVAMMDNGATKGADPSAWEIIANSPRIAGGKGALWQIHTAVNNDAAHNVPEARIANLEGPDDAGHSLELTGRRDGSFAVTNERTGERVEYGLPKPPEGSGK
jgi:competence protein ComEC